MKKVFIYFMLISWLSCNAQMPIIPLLGDVGEDAPGAYYKDTFNDFNNFTGTWEYINGNTSLRITFQKVTMYYDNYGDNYADLLIGEYHYIENGVEKVNTMNLLINPQMDAILHSIVGTSIIGNDNVPVCSDCLMGQKRIYASFSDPTRNEVMGLYGRLLMRRADAGGVQKIKIELQPTGNIIVVDGESPPYTSFNLPWGEYLLSRVP